MKNPPNNLVTHIPYPWEENVKTTASNLNREYSQRIETDHSAVENKHNEVTGNVDRYQREEKGVGTVASIAYLGGMGYKGPMEKGSSDNPKAEVKGESSTNGQ